METGLEGDSIVDSYEEEKMGCLEKVPGWMAKLQEPFLPDIELRLSQKKCPKKCPKKCFKKCPKKCHQKCLASSPSFKSF